MSDLSAPIDEGRLELAIRRERTLNLSVIQFDPAAHPRDLLGKFKRTLETAKDGQEISVPGGITVKKQGGGFSISDHNKMIKYGKPEFGNEHEAPDTYSGRNASEAAQEAIAMSLKQERPDSMGGKAYDVPGVGVGDFAGHKKKVKSALKEAYGPDAVKSSPRSPEEKKRDAVAKDNRLAAKLYNRLDSAMYRVRKTHPDYDEYVKGVKTKVGHEFDHSTDPEVKLKEMVRQLRKYGDVLDGPSREELKKLDHVK